MIVELEPAEFARALPLYRAAGATFPLVSAVLHGGQRGQVFADRRDTPGAAFVVNGFGFALFVGDERDEDFAAALARLLASADALKPKYLLWYAPPESWQARLDAAGGEVARRRGRIRYEFREERAPWLAGGAEQREGFELRNVTAELIRRTDELGVALDSRFWSSADDFVANGLGVCLTRGNDVASLCYAAAVADGLAEVDVVTRPEFRGQGLAGVVTKQFIRECLGRGLAPTWDCFDYNAGSVKLAEGVGFAELRRYPFYSFNVPLSLPAAA